MKELFDLSGILNFAKKKGWRTDQADYGLGPIHNAYAAKLLLVSLFSLNPVACHLVSLAGYEAMIITLELPAVGAVASNPPPLRNVPAGQSA